MVRNRVTKLARAAITALVATSVGAGAVADDGAVSGVGGTVTLMKPEHATIRMLSEVVHAKISGNVATVRCSFIFRNEGKACTVQMGFPETGGEDGGASWRASGLRGFRSWVKGRPVITQFVPPDRRHINACDTDCTRGWHTKPVHFAAGETVKVVDEYAADLGGRGTTDGTGSAQFFYILKTGASWKGTIGSAVINVNVLQYPTGSDSKTRLTRIATRPAGCVRKSNSLRWELRNVEPKQDICVEFSAH